MKLYLPLQVVHSLWPAWKTAGSLLVVLEEVDGEN